MEGGAVGHNFEMGLSKDYPCQVWFNLVQWFQSKLAEKISQKNPETTHCHVAAVKI